MTLINKKTKWNFQAKEAWMHLPIETSKWLNHKFKMVGDKDHTQNL